MGRFYFVLWLRWATRLTLCSVILALFGTLIITLYLYISQGMPNFNSEISEALFNIFKFWFPILWSLTLLLALFRSLKYIFNSCINGYEFKLLTCESAKDKNKEDETIEIIGYGDLVMVWRRWFMLNIWLVGSFMIFSLVYTYLFTSFNGVFEWFNIYWLFTFIILSGYFSFILLESRCKKVKVVKC
ncbi:MAG: hypothetical protein L3J19_08245 [Sulfurimonas sp.]|nr:hypothetical protein [Sulfurimonas sp.]